MIKPKHKVKAKSDAWMDDGDSAHWVKSTPKKKRISPTDKHSSVKYAGKHEPGTKKSNKKVIGKR